MAHAPKLPIPNGLFLIHDQSRSKLPVREDRVPVEKRKLVFHNTRASEVEQRLTGQEILYDMAGWTRVQEGPDPYVGWPQDWAQSYQAIDHYLTS
jgi:hypothetical protein